MVYDVISAPAIREVAISVSSCGNFCYTTQNIAMTKTVRFPDAGKAMGPLNYSAPLS
jgi:hypothetical protein